MEKNFNELLEFCLVKKSLDLPLVQCARLGARVMKNGAPLRFSVTRDFIELFKFLTEDKRTNLTTGDALAVAEEVTKHGPETATGGTDRRSGRYRRTPVRRLSSCRNAGLR